MFTHLRTRTPPESSTTSPQLGVAVGLARQRIPVPSSPHLRALQGQQVHQHIRGAEARRLSVVNSSQTRMSVPFGDQSQVHQYTQDTGQHVVVETRPLSVTEPGCSPGFGDHSSKQIKHRRLRKFFSTLGDKFFGIGNGGRLRHIRNPGRRVCGAVFFTHVCSRSAAGGGELRTCSRNAALRARARYREAAF